MSKRRMFSQDIVGSDDFNDMPATAQLLYFHLCMNADDDGFVSPRRIMRMTGSSEDDIRVLIAKRFLLAFEESKVVVIKHWKINNLIRGDRYKKTTYIKELNTLTFNEFGAYTETARMSEQIEAIADKVTTNIPETTGVVDKVATNGLPNVIPTVNPGKVRLGKYITKSKDLVTKEPLKKTSSKEIDELFECWENDVGYKLKANTKTNRDYASKLIREYGIDDAKRLVKGAALASEDQYAPRISNLSDLYRKRDQLMLWGKKRARNGGGIVTI